MTDSEPLLEAERQLAEMLLKYPDSPLRVGDIEEDLQRFLRLVEASSDEREAFAALFNDIVSGRRDAPEWLVAYCMHELRWPEIRVTAQLEVRRGLPSTLSVASEVLDSYEDDWVGRELFARFSSGR